MIKRMITGSCYILIIVGFLLIRDYVDQRIFQILPWFFCAVGTFELTRALKAYLLKGWYVLSILFGVFFVPNYAFIKYYVNYDYAWFFSVSLSLLFAIITLIYVLIKKEGLNKFLSNVLPFVYPSILILTMCLSSDLSVFGLDALLLIFIIPASADTFAYLVGMIYNKIRKGNAKKLCPKLSPKKTIAGAIGGIVGGAVASLIIYLIRKTDIINPILFFALIGVFASLLTEIGDLFESYIKRKVGIKDMGKIMPGHGGIMDRIDGMSFASVLIYLAFIIV